MIDDKSKFFGVQPEVNRHRTQSRFETGKNRFVCFGIVVLKNRDVISLSKPEAQECICEPIDAGVELRIGQLLIAIDDRRFVREEPGSFAQKHTEVHFVYPLESHARGLDLAQPGRSVNYKLHSVVS